jgi:hypothetical protein
MKRNLLIFPFALVVSCESLAQKQGSVPVKTLTEKGAQGDIILGQESKKKQLTAAPLLLNATDSSQQKKSVQRRRPSAWLSKNGQE